MFVPSQREMALFCNGVSQWLSGNLELVLTLGTLLPVVFYGNVISSLWVEVEFTLNLQICFTGSYTTLKDMGKLCPCQITP